MPYNWKCCSLYPNNFGASALYFVETFILQFIGLIGGRVAPR